MGKILEIIMSALKCFKIRVKIGTLMAVLFCIILFYITSKVLGFQNWATFDQTFFVMFYLGFYGLMVHLFNYLVDEKIEKREKEKQLKEKEEITERELQKEIKKEMAILNNFIEIIKTCSLSEKEILERFYKTSTITLESDDLNTCIDLISKGLVFIHIQPEFRGIQRATINIDGIKTLKYYFGNKN